MINLWLDTDIAFHDMIATRLLGWFSSLVAMTFPEVNQIGT